MPQAIYFGAKDGVGVYAEEKSNRLRDAYRAGQRVFRGILERRGVVEHEDFLDQLALITDQEQREGFSMGWQSDWYATDHNMKLSVMGDVRFEPEDLHESRKIKVTSAMAEPSSD